MELLLILSIVSLVFAALRVVGEQQRTAGRSTASDLRRVGRATGLRYVDEPGLGPMLRASRGDVEIRIFRTQLRVGEWFHCATATANRPLPRLVAHHRDFPYPSLARGPLRVSETGDEVFDQRFALHGSDALSALPEGVRAALLTLRCPELTVLDQRITVVWTIDGPPTERDIDAARAILETLAGQQRVQAYR